jgi:hypothetical protein
MPEESDKFCGRCEHVCVSIYSHKYTVCGLTKQPTTWWESCEACKTPEKKYWVHSGTVPYNV